MPLKNRSAKVLRFAGSRYLKRSASRVWDEHQEDLNLSDQDILAILDDSWEKYGATSAAIPWQANLGNWLIMHLAYLTLAIHHALIDSGIARDQAVALLADLTWDITSTWAEWARRFSSLFFRDRMNQLEFFVNFIMRGLFSPPLYQFELGDQEAGFFLDVYNCPVAEFMKANEAADLCVQAWCGVDFGLTEIMGGKLSRTGTIAMGKTRCDFVFRRPSE